MAELRLFNSLTKEKEIFKTKEEGKVKMYVCGITAYDDSHIGHARAYVAFDVLYRYLKHLGYEVVYVRNFTDVDDKIIKKANENKEDPIELSRRYCEEFEKDMADLQCLTPTNQPRVSEHIEDIKKMISQIIENGCAYTVEGGDVFFSVDSIPTYLVLSGRSPEDNRAGQRVEIDPRKINPADFALWKAAKPGEPSWDSPWGLGRPGWHIECSAMSAKILTHSFDIHGGGMDLIFPHHENEIAQSCAACPESNITYWLHNGVVKKNGEKMGKSAGNFSPIREVTNRYHALPLRHLLMGMHYRADLNYSTSQIEKSSDAVFRIYQTLQRCETLLVEFQKKNVTDYLDVKLSSDAQECVNKLRTEFDMKMSDDLHASAVLTGALADAFTMINACATDLEKNLRKKQLSKQQKVGPVQPLIDLEKEVRLVLGVFGLLSDSSYSEVLGQLKEKALTRAGLTEDEVSRIIEERLVLRKNKDFAGSDKIRLEMKALGIELMDEGEETIWKPYVEKD